MLRAEKRKTEKEEKMQNGTKLTISNYTHTHTHTHFKVRDSEKPTPKTAGPKHAKRTMLADTTETATAASNGRKQKSSEQPHPRSDRAAGAARPSEEKSSQPWESCETCSAEKKNYTTKRRAGRKACD